MIAASPRICRYLHIPAQSGSDRILKLMNRGYTAASYLGLLDRARRIVPDLVFAGDIIVGFPTETDEDYQATRALVAQARYKNCFIFKYSPRPGTLAVKRLPDDVPDEVKRQRNNDLLQLQNRISTDLNARMIGRTVDVLCEGATGWERPGDSLIAGAETRGAERVAAPGRVELGARLAQAMASAAGVPARTSDSLRAGACEAARDTPCNSRAVPVPTRSSCFTDRRHWRAHRARSGAPRARGDDLCGPRATRRIVR